MDLLSLSSLKRLSVFTSQGPTAMQSNRDLHTLFYGMTHCEKYAVFFSQTSPAQHAF
jgi:hypothetical protein